MSSGILITIRTGVVAICVVEVRSETHHTLLGRHELDERRFFESFYSHTEIPEAVVSRAWRTLSSVFGSDGRRLHPHDNIHECFPDFDMADLLYRHRKDFQCRTQPVDVAVFSVDDVIRYCHKLTTAPR